MKSFIAAAVAAVMFFGAAPASAEEKLHVVNRTGYTINEIYISPASSNKWEEDIMGSDALTTNTEVDIDFSKSEDTCKWDLKAVYADSDTAVWTNIDLCSISKITLFYNANTNVTSARYE